MFFAGADFADLKTRWTVSLVKFDFFGMIVDLIGDELFPGAGVPRNLLHGDSHEMSNLVEKTISYGQLRFINSDEFARIKGISRPDRKNQARQDKDPD